MSKAYGCGELCEASFKFLNFIITYILILLMVCLTNMEEVIKVPEQKKKCNKRKICDVADSLEYEVEEDAYKCQRTLVQTKTKKDDESSIYFGPKKLLEVTRKKSDDCQENMSNFIYGNYKHYYGYRNNGNYDVRLEVFKNYKQLFEEKTVLDIGCNNGFITMSVAELFNVKHIKGLDIDKSLIAKAIKSITKRKKKFAQNNAVEKKCFPFNVFFMQGNYVLKDDVLLEMSQESFDIILCLSLTKWIQLNFGDAGLKQAFRRMFLQLNSGGKLILEAQPITNYFKRKNLRKNIAANHRAIKFLPDHFTEYLLSSEVGFKKVELMGVPEHCNKGFKRPIQIFTKE